MINLIKNELTKIFKKKSILVMLLIIFGYVVLTNFIYTKIYDDNGNATIGNLEEEEISYYEKEIDNLDLTNNDDLTDYIYYRTEIDIKSLLDKYKENSWQKTIIRNNMYDTIYNINYYTYSKEKNEEELKKYKVIYNNQLKRLDANDWKTFVEEELIIQKDELKKLETTLNNETNKNKQTELQNQIKYINLSIEKLKLRLEKNISYTDSYLNQALEDYYTLKEENINYDEKKATYEEKKQHNLSLTETAKNKYVLDNNQNINQQNNSRGIFINFLDEYEILILIVIVMIGGSIVSDEYSKGTIKLLLIRPHNRSKILTSKLISLILAIILTFITIVLMQLIVGGIFFGFDSLSIPAVVYNFTTSTTQTYNIFIYLTIMFLANLPKYILIGTLAFSIGTIFKNTALATTIGILGYMGSGIINILVIEHNIEILKYFVTLNWDLGEYLFGGLPSFSYVSLPFSIAICILYFIIMLIPTYIIFKKTNIKNT